MKFIDNVLRRLGLRSIENPAMPLTSNEILKAFGAMPVKSGIAINEQTAIRNIAVFDCIRILAETPASLPLLVYRRLKNGGKERAQEHPTYTVLHDMANPEMTAMTLRETVQGHAVGWGNGYCYIVREDGYVKELWPLLPDRTEPKRINGELVYKVRMQNGEARMLNPIDVLHVPGHGFDGLVGYNPISLAREAIGLGLAAEEFGARFFGAGTNLGGVVEHPGKLGAQAHENLRSSLNQYQSLEKSHLLLILEEGMKFQKFGIPPNEAQFIDTRKFQITEIARLFRIPPHMIGDLERSTYNNIEYQAIEFVVHTLRPWLVRWEQAINYKLFTPSERKEFFAEHLVDGLLRGDSRSRAESLSTLRQNGIINADEWRELENMNPQEGGVGKAYLVNGNMLSVDYIISKESLGTESRNINPLRPTSRSAINRRRLAQAYRGLFADAGIRITRREKADVTKTGLKILETQGVERFIRWTDDYYKEAHEWITKILKPIAENYAEVVHGEVAIEINGEAELSRTIKEFIPEYLMAFAIRYTSSSVGQLKDVVQNALFSNVDVGQALNIRLSEWEERRPGKIAMNETIQLANAVARLMYIDAGITRVRWEAFGEKQCGFCSELDGVASNVWRPFVDDATKLKAEDYSEMKIYRPTYHPPLHQGCICHIVADRRI